MHRRASTFLLHLQDIPVPRMIRHVHEENGASAENRYKENLAGHCYVNFRESRTAWRQQARQKGVQEG
ncbi:hypothetical protein WN51_01836 [Melipona quadrifasciata]|uniref:Uncharacterized protein n=1 Tax=Melipona quadrifasciata TaxID=166423 RepID=A0A0M8ZZ80_9HYME|nr:hypothetical protein WN51_01836 [Melipona quadrifasciata]